MAIQINEQHLVDASAAASGTSSVENPGPQGYNVHRFFTTFTAAASVEVQVSSDGSTFFDILDSPITTSGDVTEVESPWKHLRVSWSGNTGNLTIVCEQFYSSLSGVL